MQLFIDKFSLLQFYNLSNATSPAVQCTVNNIFPVNLVHVIPLVLTVMYENLQYMWHEVERSQASVMQSVKCTAGMGVHVDRVAWVF